MTVASEEIDKERSMTQNDFKKYDNIHGKAENRSPSPIVFKVLLPLMVLIIAAVTSIWLINTAPEAKPRPPQPMATLVETVPVVFESRNALIQAMGTVMPALEVSLKPQVNGEVVKVSSNLLPGGVFQAGDMVLKIDPTDYELVVRQLKSDLDRAASELEMEQGNQMIARDELELLEETISESDMDLALRKPQLKSVEAALAFSRAKLEKAELDLSRTTITSPFNAVVKSREMNVGARVNESTTLATLVGTDEYWIEALVPTHMLKWIRIPEIHGDKGALVRIYDQAAWGDKIVREGRVIRLAADLEEQGRMARLLVSVPDPISLKPETSKKPPLLIGSYVRLEIEGVTLASVAAIGRNLIRNGDQVWIMDAEDKLDIRTVTIAFQSRDQVMVSKGLEKGERLITSRLAAPVQRMSLRMKTSGREPMGHDSDKNLSSQGTRP